MANAEQDLYFNRLMWEEVGLGRHLDLNEPANDVLQVPAVIIIDAKSIYDAMHGASGPLEMSEKRTCIEMVGIQEPLAPEQVEVRWVHGEANLANSLTKSTELEQIDSFFRAGAPWAIVQDDLILSARRRRQLGVRPLGENHWESNFLAWNYN